MAKKQNEQTNPAVTPEVTTAPAEITPQVTITEQVIEVEEERKPSERTLAEMEAGRQALAAYAKNP